MMRLLLGLALVLPLLCCAAADNKKPAAPFAPAMQGVGVRWFGHGFVMLTSSTGVRVAINPWEAESPLKYPFPVRLHADVVLVSAEVSTAAGANQLFGNPQVFRGATATGVNRAGGHLFRGVETYRDAQRGAQVGVNAAFALTLDGVRFIHYGEIGHVPDSAQRRLLGPADVIFLPVGKPELSRTDLDRMANESGARIIIPVAYRTEKSGELNLRGLEDYLSDRTNVQRVASNETLFSPNSLPATPTILVLSLPEPGQGEVTSPSAASSAGELPPPVAP